MIHIIFDKTPEQPYYQETVDAVAHAIDASGHNFEIEVTQSGDIDDAFIARLGGGVVLGPGTPLARPDLVEAVVASARERDIPLVAT